MGRFLVVGEPRNPILAVFQVSVTFILALFSQFSAGGNSDTV